MKHQFEIGVSGYTAFPRIGDPTPVRRLPPKVDPRRFYKKVLKDVPVWEDEDPMRALAQAMQRYAVSRGQHVFKATQTSPGHIQVDHLSPTGRMRCDTPYAAREHFLGYLQKGHGRVETHVHDVETWRLSKQMAEIERSHTAQRHEAYCQRLAEIKHEEDHYAKRQPSPQAEANAAADVCDAGRDYPEQSTSGAFRLLGSC